MKLIVDEFIENLKGKQASVNTVASYERDILKFTEYFNKKSKKIFDLKQSDMIEYIEFLHKEGKSNSTISRINASIKSFYKYLLSKKLVEENIASEISTPKIERKDPSILTRSEIEKLLEQPDLSDLKGQRDKAMLEVLYSSGIRVTELISLKIDDLNLHTGIIKVRKKNAERSIPLGIHATKLMDEYVNSIRPLLIKTESEKALFVNTNGQKMTRQGFWKILKQYKDDAKITKELTPHTLRHSFAIHMLQDGMDIKKVQELLGHTDVASTMMYNQYLNMGKDEQT